MMNRWSKDGFTIVELLIVIVVIGILAVIVLISYNGISQKAVVASLQSDLANASKQLKLYQIDNGVYPNSITDCPKPSAGNLCIKSSSDNTFTSYSKNNSTNPQSFVVIVTNDSKLSYVITNDSEPTQTSAPSPLAPVADYLATPQGEHYGNYLDLVSMKYATVSRSTSKTIYDPSRQKIYDVPANYLAINPRSDGKSGSEAVIEESRTNYFKNSSFEIDANSNGSADNWAPQNTTTILPTYTLSDDSVHGLKSQNIQYIGQAGETGKLIDIYQSSSSAAFAVGENAYFCIYEKGSLSGATLRLQIQARNSSNATVGSVQATNVAVSSGWARVCVAYPSLPANTDYLLSAVWIEAIDQGDIVDIKFDSGQIEKGTFATSFIPTTTAATSRSADIVKIPTAGWGAGVGAMVGVSYDTPAPMGNYYLGHWRGSNGSVRLYRNWNNSRLYYQSSGLTADAASSWPAGYSVHTGVWDIPSTRLSSYINNAPGAQVNPNVLMTLPETEAAIGSDMSGTVGFYNGPIQRLVIYAKALSDSDVTSVSNAVKDGP